MVKTNSGNIGIIAHVDSARPETLEAASNLNHFVKENLELVIQILQENRKIIKELSAMDNPQQYLKNNPQIAEGFGITNDQMLCIVAHNTSRKDGQQIH